MTFKQSKVIASSQVQDASMTITTTTTYTAAHDDVLASRFIDSKLYTLEFKDITTISNLAQLTSNITDLDDNSFKLLSDIDIV